MTSLAEQLNKLRLPGQDRFDLEARNKVSLLFTDKVAGTLDNQAILKIGQSGLEGLLEIDDVFLPFSENLFSNNSLALDRTHEDPDVHKKLGKRIEKFLCLASPYLQLKDTQKCLEWLIRRFRAHSYEKEALIACILPYHETQLFARIVQVIVGNEDKDDEWKWLQFAKKSAMGFSLQQMTTCFDNNPAMIHFLWKAVMQAAETCDADQPKSGLKVIFPFFTRLMMSIIDSKRTIGEQFVLQLMPQIYEALKAPNVDLILSCFMILMQLCSKASLSEPLVQALISHIVKTLRADIYEPSLCCITSLVSHQKVKKLAKRTVKLLIEQDSAQFFQAVLSLQQQGFNICPLTNLLVQPLCKGASKGKPFESDVLSSFVDQLDLADKTVKSITKCLISEYTSACAEDNEQIGDQSKKIIKVLLRRYRSLVDDIIQATYTELTNNNDEQAIKHLDRLTVHNLTLSKYSLVGDQQLPLVLSLNHQQAHIRKQAVQQLLSEYTTNPSAHEPEFVRNSILARLDDEEADVVNTVIQHSKSLVNVLDGEVLYRRLMHMMSGRSSAAKKSAGTLDEMVSSVNVNPLLVALVNWNGLNKDIENEFVFALLGHVISAVGVKGNKDLLSALDGCELTTDNPLLRCVLECVKRHNLKELASKEPCTEDQMASIYNAIFVQVVAALRAAANGMDLLSELWTYCHSLPTRHVLHFVACMITSVALSKQGSVTDAYTLLQQVRPRAYLEKLCGSAAISDVIMVQLMSDCSTLDVMQQVPKRHSSTTAGSPSSSVDLHQINMLAGFTMIREFLNVKDIGSYKNSLEGDAFCLKRDLFHLLAVNAASNHSNASLYRHLLDKLLLNHFDGKISLLQFLCHLASPLLDEATSAASMQVGVCALHLIKVFVASVDDLDKLTTVIHLHVCLLHHCNPFVRSAALSNLAHMDGLLDEGTASGYLVQKVVQAREPCATDPTHIQRLLQKVCKQVSRRKSSALPSFALSKSTDASTDVVSTNVAPWLISHMSNSTVHFNVALMNVLQDVNNEHMFVDIYKAIGPCITKVIDAPSSTSDDPTCKLLCQFLNKYTLATMASFKSHPATFEFLLKAVAGKNAIAQNAAIKQVTPELFASLSGQQQLSFVKRAFQALRESANGSVASSLRSSLTSVNVPGGVLASLLREFVEFVNARRGSEDKPKIKKRKMSLSEEMMETDGDDTTDDVICKTADWLKMTNQMEVLYKIDHVTDVALVMEALLSILKKCMEIRDSTEYALQLVLSNIIKLLKQKPVSHGPHGTKTSNAASKDKLSDEKFDVYALVECLQTSKITKTHQHCLSVLSLAASLYPTLVLHNIMHIFTFMSGQTIKIDDQHSFDIMKETIRAIVSELLKQSEPEPPAPGSKRRTCPTEDTHREIVSFILETFVDSAPYCPVHRRVHIFKHLLNVVGEEKHLHSLILLLIKKSMKQGKAEKGTTPVTLEFCQQMLECFPLESQVLALCQLVGHLNSLQQTIASTDDTTTDSPPSAKKAMRIRSLSSSSAADTFDVEHYTSRDMRLLKFSAVRFISQAIGAPAIQDAYGNTQRSLKKLTKVFLGFLEEILSYAESIEKCVNEDPSSSAPSSQSGESPPSPQQGSSAQKFWRSLLAKVYEIVGGAYEILPFNSFIKILSGLLNNTSPLTRKKSLELLCTKLQQTSEVQGSEQDTLVKLYSTLLNRVAPRPKSAKTKDVKKDGSESDAIPDVEETPVNKQMMLIVMTLLVRKFATTNPEKFSASMPVILTLFSSAPADTATIAEETNSTQQHHLVAINAVMCAAELCHQLTTQSIQHLPVLFPALLALFHAENSGHKSRDQDVYLTSLVTSLHRILTALASFMSPWILDTLCALISTERLADDLSNRALKLKIGSCKTDMAKAINARVLLPKIDACFEKLCTDEQQGFTQINNLAEMLHRCVENISVVDANTHLKGDLLNLFKKFLNVPALVPLHNNSGDEMSLDDYDVIVNSIEQTTTDALTALVMKMSENTFRPIYLELLKWSSADAASGSCSRRQLSFFRMSVAMATNLKSLFLLFLGHVLDGAAELLTQLYKPLEGEEENQAATANDTNRLSVQLVTAVVDCISVSLSYDTQGFINKQRFDLLLPALACQLDNAIMDSNYMPFIDDHLAPALGNFTAAMQDSSLWKPLNSTILGKSKSAHQKVRLASLHVIKRVYNKLGEGLNSILPESIPFLAELLEDESPEVENFCQKVISDVERYTGESLKKYM